MRKIIFVFAVSFVAILPFGIVHADMIGGVEFPQGIVSFADQVFSYTPGSGVVDPYNDPNQALGVPNYSGSIPGHGHCSLGSLGSLTLMFTDNALTPSGNSNLDLWIFEVGTQVENMRVSISKDGTNFVWVGDVAGQPTGIDIDAVSGVAAGDLYKYVKIEDLAPLTSYNPYAGADIDAVGAISTVVTSSVPEPATLLLLGLGLVGLSGLRRKLHK